MARLALAPGLAVTLLSAEGAAIYAGAGWWRALIAAARRDYPDATHTDILDCGDAPGRALEALRIGQPVLILRAEPRIFADLSQRAAAIGAVMLPDAPPALDLGERQAARRLRAWLESGSGAEPAPL